MDINEFKDMIHTLQDKTYEEATNEEAQSKYVLG